jgi:hypothetical protein
LKVFEYDFAEGLRTKSAGEGDNVIEVRFPQARIIYWETTGKTPDEVTLRLRFSDGKHHDYNVRTFKFLDHDISELEKQKLAILLPFYVLKLRKRVVSAKTSKRRAELAGEMKSIFDELVAAVDRNAEAGLMSESDKRIVLEHMERLHKELYSPYRELKEVDTMLQERILTYSEEAAAKATKAAEEAAAKAAEKAAAKAAKATEKAAAKAAKATEKAAVKAAEKAKFEVAQKMLTRGMALPDIAEIAGLPMDKLQTLIPHS